MAKAQQFKSVRGMNDLLPDQAAKFDQAISVFKQLAEEAGFGRIETPTLEQAGVFIRGVGTGTDIIDKEIYAFKDRSDEELALRPEGTAGVVRAFIEHGMSNWPQPVQLYYTESIFRYDRPQAGRYRQHWQMGLEVLGEAAPSADAHVITLANRLYRQLGLSLPALQINSIGDAACRPKYRKALVEYLTEHEKQLCEKCRERVATNPLRVLDCKEDDCQAVIAGAPQTLNYLCKACQAHLSGVLEYLDDLGVRYELNPLIVRGLDYYTRTVWEFYGRRAGAQSSLGSGGRYDGLAETLGGAPTPGVGMAIGVERVLLELEEENVKLSDPLAVKVYVASLGEPARLTGFRLIEHLLDGGVGAIGAVDRSGIQGQLSRANRLGLPYAIIIGQKEVFDKTVILRDMASGVQETIPQEKIVANLARRFGGGK